MRAKSSKPKASAERVVKDIRRATRRHFSTEDKIRIVLEGLRGDDSIAELCRKEGIAQSLYYTWSKEFMEAGKRRLAGDTARAATSDEVRDLRHQTRDLKECVANIRFGYENSDGSIQITAFAKNVTKTRYRVIAFDVSSLGLVENYPGMPRWFGLELTYSIR